MDSKERAEEFAKKYNELREEYQIELRPEIKLSIFDIEQVDTKKSKKK